MLVERYRIQGCNELPLLGKMLGYICIKLKNALMNYEITKLNHTTLSDQQTEQPQVGHGESVLECGVGPEIGQDERLVRHQ